MWGRGDAVGLALQHRFIDPVTCRECLFNGRRELDLDVLNEILERYESRTEVFVESFSRLNIDTRQVKHELNMRGITVIPRIIEALRDPYKGLALVAAANGVDWRMKWASNSNLGEIEDAEALVEETAVKALQSSSSIAIALDNAGEAVVDIAFGLILAEKGHDVVLIARSLPYETDVTEDEARKLLQNVASTIGYEPRVEVVGTGSRYPAFARGRTDSRVLEAINRADIVLSKGIANYEALLEYCTLDPEKVIVALAAKCPPIAGLLGVKLGTPVVRMGYSCRLSRS